MGDLDDLGEKLDVIRAEKNAAAEESRRREQSADDMGRSSLAGAHFISSVISGGLLGYVIDRFAETAPWGLIGFMALGLVAGVYAAGRAP